MSSVTRLATGPLKNKLIEIIRSKGPLSVADYMKIVLTNPESGFYMNDDVFGVKGHFTTSPEISQLFGEVIGAWVLQEWRRFGSPRPLKLIEFGPGRGTLMSDVARTICALEKPVRDDLQIKLIEMSPKLTEVQRKTLEKQNGLAKQARWYSLIEQVEKDDSGFTAFLAHEYLDALPIHKFVRDPTTNAWRELVIDYDANQELRFCISRQPSLASRLLIPENFKGNHFEVCPQAALQLERVSERLNSSRKGCMLICDYGFERDYNNMSEDKSPTVTTSVEPVRHERDTFRAFKNHQSWPPLKDPGEADLTADVDFGYLKRHLKDKSLIFGSVDQATFLTNCGLQARLQVLLKNASEDEKRDLLTGAEMIIEDMGTRYRFMALFPATCKAMFEQDPPAGFMEITSSD